MTYRCTVPLTPGVSDAILVGAGNSRAKFAFAGGETLRRLGSVSSIPHDVILGARACCPPEFGNDDREPPGRAVTPVRPDLNAAACHAFPGVVRDFFFLDFGSLRELPLGSAAAMRSAQQLSHPSASG